MQDLPDAPTVLGEVARFLNDSVRPAIEDRGLAFRVRIAAHLLGVIARETSLAEGHLDAEAARLAGLLGETAPERDVADWVLAQNTRLAQGLRAGAFDAQARAAIRQHLLETLAETLTVVQPDFDRRLELD